MKKKKAVTWYYFLSYLDQVSILEYKHYLNEEVPLKYCILNVRKTSKQLEAKMEATTWFPTECVRKIFKNPCK